MIPRYRPIAMYSLLLVFSPPVAAAICAAAALLWPLAVMALTAQAVGQPLTPTIADLDRFKIVNDNLGHIVGDEALWRSVSLMRYLCRETDLVHPHLRVTVSIGEAQWDGVADGMALLETADAQLYRAKWEGRNRVA